MSEIIIESLSTSPCISVCTTRSNPEGYLCKGCGRTRQEVEDWDSFTDLEKKMIVMNCWNSGFMPKQKLNYFHKEIHRIQDLIREFIK